MVKPKAAPKNLGGRPARADSPERLVVRIPGELKRWLAHRAIDERRDMGQIVGDLLLAYRGRVERGGRP
jgi:hypothetical protein